MEPYDDLTWEYWQRWMKIAEYLKNTYPGRKIFRAIWYKVRVCGLMPDPGEARILLEYFPKKQQKVPA